MSGVFREEILGSMLFHIPHASAHIPDRRGYVSEELLQQEILRSTDWASDLLFRVEGIDRVVCPWSRVFCDVERFEEDPLDALGYGYYYTHTHDGDPLRDESLRSTVLHGYYQPYHRELIEKVKTIQAASLGHCTLIDCHTFPDEPFPRDDNQSKPRPDICIGVNPDNTHKTDIAIMGNFFDRQGFDTRINDPYVGALTPQGIDKVNAIMIEINRKLYMDGARIELEKVLKLNRILHELFEIYAHVQ